MPHARRRSGGRGGRRARGVRSTQASDAAVGSAARIGHLRERATAGTARSGRPEAHRGWPERHRRLAAAALWRRCGLRERGARHAVNRGRPGREARAACRQQESQIKLS